MLPLESINIWGIQILFYFSYCCYLFWFDWIIKKLIHNLPLERKYSGLHCTKWKLDSITERKQCKTLDCTFHKFCALRSERAWDSPTHYLAPSCDLWDVGKEKASSCTFIFQEFICSWCLFVLVFTLILKKKEKGSMTIKTENSNKVIMYTV